ncbi:MAG: hypothetical protein DWQ44_04185 [Bacteroidetes bacterium]|nr:MAG: hypothetical protein DWQ44_04185 [Bacteroidota bacterium]
MKYVLISIAVLMALCSCNTNSNESEMSTEALIISYQERTAHTVYLTKNHLHQPVICWSEEDTITGQKFLHYSISHDHGVSFIKNKDVPLPGEVKLHPEGMPKIAFRHNGEVYVFYEVSTTSEFNRFAGEIHYIVSKNEGNDWSPPHRVHQDSSQHKAWSFLDVTLLSDGEIEVCWLDTSLSGKGRSLKFARTDSEGNFTNEIIVDSLACECCRTAIYCDALGTIGIVYRDIINDSIRDISVSFSTDMGKSFSKPVCFSGDNWNINGCPHNGPDVTVNSNGIYSVWFTGAMEKGLYYAELDKKGGQTSKRKISDSGTHIQMCLLNNEQRVMVYNEMKKVNEIYHSQLYAQIQPAGKIIALTPGNSDATLPSVTDLTDGFGVVWIEKGKVLYKSVKVM